VLLEPVAIAERRWREDRWTEPDRIRIEDRVIVSVASLETIDEVPENRDTESASKAIIQGADRLTVKGRIVLERRAPSDRSTSGGLQVEPSAVVERRRKAPGGAGWCMPLADVGEPHRRSPDM